MTLSNPVPLIAESSADAIEIESEISHSSVIDLVQDRQGFIWVATEAGLNRYDGYDISQFYKQSHGLSSDSISALELDSNGHIWLGTDAGLSVFWQDKGVFQNFYHNAADNLSIASDQIYSLASAENGNLWVGTSNGISYFQLATQSFQPFTVLNAVGVPEVNQEISAIEHTAETTLLGTKSGLLAQLNEQGFFEQVSADMTLDSIVQILQITESRFYVLTESALYEWDLSSQHLELVDLKSLGLDSEFIEISRLQLGQGNRLWIGTTKDGLFRVNLDSKQSEQYFYRRKKEGNVGIKQVKALLEDSTGVLWLGTEANLYRLNPSLIKFEHYQQQAEANNAIAGDSVFALMVDSDGWYWFGTEFDGISVLKPQGRQLVKDAALQLPSVQGYSVNSIVEGKNGIIWILVADSLWSYDKNTGDFKQHSELDFEGATLYSAQYYQAELWVSSSSGLWRLTENGKLQHYLADQQLFNDKNRVLSFVIEPNSDSIWLATEQGILKFNISTETFTELSELVNDLPNGLSGTIYDLYLDIHGRLWVGSYLNGLYKIDFTKQEIEVINSNNSMLNNVIYSIQPDSDHLLWLATARGLFRFDTNDNSLTHFDKAQGQPVRDFNLGAKTQDLNGKLLLGGINGVIHFDPKDYQEDLTPATPVITDILINSQTAKVGPNETDHSQLPVNITKKIRLFHGDTSLAIVFSAMHFSNPKYNRYSYKLDGYDKDWIEVDANGRRAIYPKLESGSYRFELLAANKDGNWSQLPVSLEIEVLPSPYFSNIALLIYALLLSAAVFVATSLYRSRINERSAAQQRLAESEERLKLSLWGSGDELWDWDLNTGALHLSNEWDQDFPRDGIRSGYSEANSNIHPNDLPYVKQALNAHINGKSKHFESTYRLSDERGGWIWVLDQGKSVEFDGSRPIRMAGTLKNVSEIKDAEQRLSVIAKSFENISDAVWILDSDLRYIVINKAFETITGYTEEEVIGAPMQENAIKDMTENFYQKLMVLLEEKGSWQGELEAIRSDGTPYPIDINIDVVRDNDGNVINYVGVFSDITYRKIAEKELRRLATTDQLTSLPNRNTFRSEVETIISRSKNGDLHALLFIDLDNFKRINDSLGHSVGDELLMEVAANLQNVMATNKGIVARLGGDEFIIFLQDVAAWSHPANVAQEVLDAFSNTLKLTANEVMVSPSIGIVMYPENGDTADELLRNADTAMYYAKKKGKNTFQFYTRQMNEQAKMRLNLENDLRTAIERDEFVVFYQPKVCLETGAISGFEALVRWRNEKRGLVMPNEFIPLAEESGLIIPISQQVIEKACIQVRDWQKRGLFNGKMAINLSAVQFYHEDLWETVKNALHLANLEASSIEFEITEGMVMQDLAHSIQQMKTLKDMGVSLALDDFGVGYSSLGNLKDFPIDTLKIDRSFVWDLDDSVRDRKLVASIITLAHNLDIKVVAEGV
ncbi:MAG: EAL domain-containing protein, partial [Gammaproteobacteria bacterium]|nr:EAL domain-containing protein [Gammaproteobacteria bacterium]